MYRFFEFFFLCSMNIFIFRVYFGVFGRFFLNFIHRPTALNDFFVFSSIFLLVRTSEIVKFQPFIQPLFPKRQLYRIFLSADDHYSVRTPRYTSPIKPELLSFLFYVRQTRSNYFFTFINPREKETSAKSSFRKAYEFFTSKFLSATLLRFFLYSIKFITKG